MNTIIDPQLREPVRSKVERAADILEQQLSRLDDFDITARWHSDAGVGRDIALDLVVIEQGAKHGVYSATYPTAFFDQQSAEIRAGLGLQVDQLLVGLREIIRAELKGIRKRLTEMSPVSGSE